MKRTPWHVAVLIPARNEEVLLPRCLASVITACDSLPSSATADIIVVCDRSTDSTLQIAEDMLGDRGQVLTIQEGTVGHARAAAAKIALQRYGGPFCHCWLANTDADCCVPTTWLIDQLSLADCGIEAVAGIIDVDSFEDHGADAESRFRNSYLIYEDGSHPHVHGANLGVRADAYLLAGGWSGLETAEDHDLWERLSKTVSQQRSTARVRVITSGRRTGRAPKGFADALAAHNEVTTC